MSMWNAGDAGGLEGTHPVGSPTRGHRPVPGVAQAYTGKPGDERRGTDETIGSGPGGTLTPGGGISPAEAQKQQQAKDARAKELNAIMDEVKIEWCPPDGVKMPGSARGGGSREGAAAEEGEEDEVQTTQSNCCLSELIRVKKKYAALRQRLDELQEQVQRPQHQQHEAGQQQARQPPPPPPPSQQEQQRQSSEESSARYRQWYEAIKKELAETAKLLQERDEENDARSLHMKATIEGLREELILVVEQMEGLKVAREAADEARKEAESRREVAEAAAGALVEEVDMWKQKAEAVDVQQVTLLRSRATCAEEEVERMRVEVEVARQRYSEAMQRADQSASRVSTLCQELGTWQERARLNEEEGGRLKTRLDKLKASSEEDINRLRQETIRLQTQLRAQEDGATERLRKTHEDALRIQRLEEEKRRLMERLEDAEERAAAATAVANLSRGADLMSSPQRQYREGDAAMMMQQENNRLRDTMSRQRESWEEKVAALDAVITEQRGENDAMHKELDRLSEALTSANRQLVGYDNRLQQLEASAVREKERELEMQAARRQLMRDRMMIESVLAKELGRVASSSSIAMPPVSSRDANLGPGTQVSVPSGAGTDVATSGLSPIGCRGIVGGSPGGAVATPQGSALFREVPLPFQVEQQHFYHHPTLSELLVNLEDRQTFRGPLPPAPPPTASAGGGLS